MALMLVPVPPDDSSLAIQDGRDRCEARAYALFVLFPRGFAAACCAWTCCHQFKEATVEVVFTPMAQNGTQDVEGPVTLLYRKYSM